MVRMLTERYDNKCNVILSGFRSQLQASYVSSHTEELWFNETVCLWMIVYINSRAIFYKFTPIYRCVNVWK